MCHAEATRTDADRAETCCRSAAVAPRLLQLALEQVQQSVTKLLCKLCPVSCLCPVCLMQP